jgi:tetratricopeptide (TPR) repeat protein
MKINMYEPCSCGSGKKFKFCCYLNRQSLDGISDSELLKRSAEFPVYRAWASSDWQKEGLAQVLIARQLPNLKYIVGTYLVDTFCLGLKKTFYRTHFTYDDLMESLEQFHGNLDEISYENARSIILGGIEYAQQYGFEPHKDWNRSSVVIEPDRSYVKEFSFGKNGMPLYIQGPHDNVTKIMEKLNPFIKEGKAHFMSALESFEEEDLSIDDFIDQRCESISDLMERKNFKVAKLEANQLIRDFPERSESLFLLGTCHAMEGNMKEAVPILEKSLEMNPTAPAYYNLAGVYRPMMKLREAIECLKNVIKIDGKRGEYGKRAKTELDELITSIETTSGLSVDTYLANKEQFEIAFKNLTAGNYLEAIEGFNKVLEIEPKHVQSFGNQGLAFAHIGDRENAIRNFDKAIALDPSYQPAIDNRRLVLNLQPGETIRSHKMKEIEFYADKANEEIQKENSDTLEQPESPTGFNFGEKIKNMFFGKSDFK